MKPFLGIDLTENKKNEQFNGDVFLTARPSSATARSFEQSSEKADETLERSKLPLPLRIVQGVCGFLGAIVAVGILRSTTETPLAQGYENAPWLFWAGGVLLAVWGILKFASVKKSKAVLETDESAYTLSNLDRMCEAVYAELAVPAAAREADILSFFYKMKDGKMKVCEKGMMLAPYMNPIFRVYADSQNLYLVNLEGKYTFPLSSMVAIHTVKKRISIVGWNKVEQYNKGIFKQFKLTANNYGCIFCNRYHIIEVKHNDESYGIYIPNYELPVFEKLTGLKAPTE